MNQNFTKGKNLPESSKMEHFQCGKGGGGGLKILRVRIWEGKNFGHLPAFWAGGKNLPYIPEKKYGNIS